MANGNPHAQAGSVHRLHGLIVAGCYVVIGLALLAVLLAARKWYAGPPQSFDWRGLIAFIAMQKKPVLVLGIAFIGFGVLLTGSSRIREALIERLAAGSLAAWAGYLALTLIVVHCFEHGTIHRIVFGCFLAPAVVAIVPAFVRCMKRRRYHTRVALGFLAMVLIARVVPGMFFPPFFNGIGGWVTRAGASANPTHSGLQLVRDDGATVWFSHSFASPAPFPNRQLGANMNDDRKLLAMTRYYVSLYRKHYPVLQTGRLPTERWLGPLSYPGHNPYRHIDYTDFPPERLRALEFVTVTHDATTHKLLTRRVQFSYDLTADTLSRPKSTAAASR